MVQDREFSQTKYRREVTKLQKSIQKHQSHVLSLWKRASYYYIIITHYIKLKAHWGPVNDSSFLENKVLKKKKKTKKKKVNDFC